MIANLLDPSPDWVDGMLFGMVWAFVMALGIGMWLTKQYTGRWFPR